MNTEMSRLRYASLDMTENPIIRVGKVRRQSRRTFPCNKKRTRRHVDQRSRRRLRGDNSKKYVKFYLSL